MKTDTHLTQKAEAAEQRIASLPRFIITSFLSLVVWITTKTIVGFIMVFLFPLPGGTIDVGIGLEWRNLPGTVLGFLAACRTWHIMIDRHVELLRKNSK